MPAVSPPYLLPALPASFAPLLRRSLPRMRCSPPLPPLVPRRYACNVCQMVNEVPVEYFCALDANGRRLDHDQRPELCGGSVEYVAPAEYMVGVWLCGFFELGAVCGLACWLHALRA